MLSANRVVIPIVITAFLVLVGAGIIFRGGGPSSRLDSVPDADRVIVGAEQGSSGSDDDGGNIGRNVPQPGAEVFGPSTARRGSTTARSDSSTSGSQTTKPPPTGSTTTPTTVAPTTGTTATTSPTVTIEPSITIGPTITINPTITIDPTITIGPTFTISPTVGEP